MDYRIKKGIFQMNSHFCTLNSGSLVADSRELGEDVATLNKTSKKILNA